MRILVDEDLASRELLGRLERLLPGIVLAPAREASDEAVWQRAQEEAAAVLTGNAVDFLALAGRSRAHAGLLLVYRSNDRRRDMTAGSIAEAVTRILETYPDGVAGMTLVVNSFAGRRDPAGD